MTALIVIVVALAGAVAVAVTIGPGGETELTSWRAVLASLGVVSLLLAGSAVWATVEVRRHGAGSAIRSSDDRQMPRARDRAR